MNERCSRELFTWIILLTLGLLFGWALGVK